jgi:ABC-type glycerol-3-phosphate transport system substrate-binding protein
MNNWQTSKVIQFRTAEKENSNMIEINKDQINKVQKIKSMQKELKDELEILSKKVKDFKKEGKKLKRDMDKLLGKSKLDIFWENKTNTPRKIKLLQNKGISVPNEDFYNKLDSKKLKETIEFYLKKYSDIIKN